MAVREISDHQADDEAQGNTFRMSMTTDFTPAADPLGLRLPPPYRCGIAFTFDTDMCHGYSPVDLPGCHGRVAPFLAGHMRRMMDVAEALDVRLHWFAIANGLENGLDWSVFAEALERGHDVDSHTYNHVNLSRTAPDELSADLRLSNIFLKRHLGIDPVVLRGPGGIPWGALGPASRRVILDAGFGYVSSELPSSCTPHFRRHPDLALEDPRRFPVHRYPEGLVEIPLHGWCDRGWFEDVVGDADALLRWRREGGHRPVPEGWRCPWTRAGALDGFIDFHKRMFDFAYEHRLFIDFVSHPYGFYLHDPESRFLHEIVAHLRARPEPVWTGTLRDAIRQFIGPAHRGA